VYLEELFFTAVAAYVGSICLVAYIINQIDVNLHKRLENAFPDFQPAVDSIQRRHPDKFNKDDFTKSKVVEDQLIGIQKVINEMNSKARPLLP